MCITAVASPAARFAGATFSKRLSEEQLFHLPTAPTARIRVAVAGFFAVMLLANAGSAADTKPASATDTSIVLSTGIISRALDIQDGVVHTTRIHNQVTGDELAVHDAQEFEIRLWEGPCLCTEDYRLAERKATQDDSGQRVTLTLRPQDASHPRIVIELDAQAGQHFIRKRLRVTGDAVVDSIAVEKLGIRAAAEVGGFGQPVFLDDRWFAGLEYPAGTNDLTGEQLSCVHHPGRHSFDSQWAVVGSLGLPEAQLEDEFQRYLETIRRPSRPSLQYNTWFDRRSDDINPHVLGATFERWQDMLLAPFDLHFDAFVIDDGYQAPCSLWDCSTQWPDGLKPLAQYLSMRGSRLGLWLALNGYNLNTDWGAARGFERSNHRKGYYCLAGPTYNRELRSALKQRIVEGNLSYLKHDFNYLACSAQGHGHLPTKRHGLEANVDAQLALLDYERQLQPDIFLNVTSYIWPSPWWLARADALWMGSSDYAHDWSTPHWCEREAEMTFRDAQLYRVLRIERAQVPASMLMTHGIIRGRHDHTTPKETLQQWSDYVVMFFGRGTLLHELYISPDQLPTEYWPVLGRALQWARANTETLAQTRMIGGRPDRNEPYGYLHWSADKGIVCLRNPAPLPHTITLSLGQRPAHLPQTPRWHPIIVYPYHELASPVSSSGQLTLRLPSASVVLIELYPQVPEVLRKMRPGRFGILGEGDSLRLVSYADPPPIEARTSVPVDDQRKHWHGVFTLAGNGKAKSSVLQVVRTPAHGAMVAVSVVSANNSLAIDTSYQGRNTAADITRYAWKPNGPATLDLKLWLPPSPLWPQRSVTSVLLRRRRPLPVTTDVPLGSETSVPLWPMPQCTGERIEEIVLVDGKVLDRRRSAIESFAWALLLTVVPVGACVWSVRRWAPSSPPWLRYLVSWTVYLGLAMLYWLSPLAGALREALYH